MYILFYVQEFQITANKLKCVLDGGNSRTRLYCALNDANSQDRTYYVIDGGDGIKAGHILL